ncbi:DNA primase [bacterium]|nr:DNA primase [bacterium]
MGNHTETSLRKDKLFDKTLGLILNSIIVDVAEIEGHDRTLFKEIKSFILKYNNLPTYDALVIEIDSLRNIKEEQVKTITDTLKELSEDKIDTNIDWLSDSTEKFCQEKAIYNAIMKSIDVMNNKNSTLTKGAIPQLLSDALSVSFDPNVGHDYLEQYDYRYEYYHRVLEKIPFDLEFFNKITKNGLPKKTLNIALAGTGVGKSLFMCHVAASCLNQGRNVLYITLELAEEEVAKRIDANLMNVTFEDLMRMPKDMYEKKAENLKSKTNGKLIIKEYPTAGASTIHFKALLNELSLKKSFKPDIIFVDYLNICMSARVKPGSNINSYTYIKSIAEELRGLAVEYSVPVVSATQTTRSGFSNSDVELTDTSESFGLPATADFMFALIATEELDALGQIMVKQLKNRYNDPTINKRFVLGIDRAKMKLFDVEASAQHDISDSGQVTPTKPNNKDRFKSLKVV